jgi:circadian clock protein KaiB
MAPATTTIATARLQLRLYVAGGAPNSTMAESNLTSLLESNGVTDYELEIIDCIKDPRRALGDGVLVTPTLMRVAPPPPQTIVGTLSDAARVGAALGLPASAPGGRASA